MSHLLKKKWFVCIALIVLAFVLYFPSLQVGFLSDDFHMLAVAKENSNMFSYFATNIAGTTQGSSYGPMFNVITIAQYLAFGMNPLWYHVVSIGLYGFLSAVVFLFSRRISGQTPSTLIALLFVVLPGHVEAVSWIAVQVHLFATLFFVLSLYYYHRYVCARNRWYFYLLALLCASIALLTKEIAITFIAMFGLIDLFYGTSEKEHKKKISIIKILKRISSRLLIPLGLVGGYLFVRHAVTGSVAGYYAGGAAGFTPYKYIRTTIEILSSMFLDFPKRFGVFHWMNDQRGLVVLLAIFALMFLFLSKQLHRKRTGFALLALVIGLLPYMQVLLNPVNNEGERYGLLPSIFVCMLMVYFFYALLSVFGLAKKNEWLIAVLVIATCVWMTPQVYSKQGSWVYASDQVNKILHSAHDVSLEDAQEVVVVGLPDNYEGAQALRNGFFEALLMQEGIEWKGERVPLYIHTDASEALKVEHVIPDGKNKLIANKSFKVFTGFREYRVGEVKFSLEAFEMPGFLGESILIEGESSAALIYFDGEKLQKL
ncbi:hypothetical protein H6758_04915 [Candidatus Nomurabacteria bacterium]|nr:hypothetical protein [Candidatus Nomurabacteria bacterium]